jgi:hypothetical protein
VQEAEVAQQDAEETEALLLQHTAQVRGAAPRPPYALHWHPAPAMHVAPSGIVCTLLLLHGPGPGLNIHFGTPHLALTLVGNATLVVSERVRFTNPPPPTHTHTSPPGNTHTCDLLTMFSTQQLGCINNSLLTHATSHHPAPLHRAVL